MLTASDARSIIKNREIAQAILQLPQEKQCDARHWWELTEEEIFWRRLLFEMVGYGIVLLIATYIFFGAGYGAIGTIVLIAAGRICGHKYELAREKVAGLEATNPEYWSELTTPLRST